MTNYRPRLIDELLESNLRTHGGVLIIGPKWCGKTTTANKYAKSFINFQNQYSQENYLNAIRKRPSSLLVGEYPRLIDEWQVFPQIWNSIIQEIYRFNQNGLFILTGSNRVDKSKIMRPDTEDILKLKMYSMTLYESGFSNGIVSLGSLFRHENVENSIISSLTIEKISELIVRGGWPGNIDKDLSTAIRQNKLYIDLIADQEMEIVDGKIRDRDMVLSILCALARNTATSVSDKTLLRDISEINTPIHIDTLHSYLTLLADLFVIEDLPAWTPKLKSNSIVSTRCVRHFIEPALTAALLKATPSDLLRDFETFGFLFESLVVRDLRVYAQMLSGNVYHYRDSSGLEVDAIIRLLDGKWAAIEIKLGSALIEEAANHLIKLKESVDFKSEPEFMMIVTGTQYGYKREDGIWVVPIGCLKP